MNLKELINDRIFRVGWILWVVQAVFVIFPIVYDIPIITSVVYQFFDQTNSLSILYYIRYSVFVYSLRLDLIALFLICFSIVRYFWKKNEGEIDLKSLNFFLPLSGFLWIISTVLWRFPLFSIWDYESILIWQNRYIFVYTIELLQIVAAIFLLIFFVLLANYLLPIVEYNRDLDNYGFGKEKILGILNFSNVFILFTRAEPFYILIVVIKFVIVPIFVILTCQKMLSLRNKSYPEDEFITEIRSTSQFKFEN